VWAITRLAQRGWRAEEPPRLSSTTHYILQALGRPLITVFMSSCKRVYRRMPVAGHPFCYSTSSNAPVCHQSCGGPCSPRGPRKGSRSEVPCCRVHVYMWTQEYVDAHTCREGERERERGRQTEREREREENYTSRCTVLLPANPHTLHPLVCILISPRRLEQICSSRLGLIKMQTRGAEYVNLPAHAVSKLQLVAVPNRALWFVDSPSILAVVM
jgi:hypothetical protein